jgi:GTPase involved in cell partitioning and DNA repair
MHLAKTFKKIRYLNNELKSYSKELSKRKKIVAFTKADVYSDDELAEVKKRKIKGYRAKTLVMFGSQRLRNSGIIRYTLE